MIGLCIPLVNLKQKASEDNNDVSISDAETQSGNEHSSSHNENDNDDVHVDTQPDNDKEPDNEVEIEPAVDFDKHYKKIHFRDDTCLSQQVTFSVMHVHP